MIANHQVRSKARRNLSEQSSRIVEDVKQLGRAAVTSAGEAAANLRDVSVKGVKKMKGRVDAVVAGNPMKSVLIALGVGVGVGVALTYALRRRS